MLMGEKTEYERLPGGATSYTIEALMQNGWVLQAGISHVLGRTFDLAFNVTFKDAEGEEKLVWITSLGMTKRTWDALS